MLTTRERIPAATSCSCASTHSAEWPNLAQRQAVEDRAHRVFADAKVHVAPGLGRAEFDCAGECEPCLGRRGEIGRATHQPGDVLGEGVEHLATRLASGLSL